MKQICKLVVMLLLAFTAGVQAQLVTYPESLNPGMPHNDDYTVRVRIPGGEWKDLFEYNVQVDMDNVQNASMVQFDMGSAVEVMVKKNNGSVREVTIRPLSKGIEYKQIQNAILFTLEKPQYLSIEFDGDRLHNLHLFANLWKQKNMIKRQKASCTSVRESTVLKTYLIIKSVFPVIHRVSGTGSGSQSETSGRQSGKCPDYRTRHLGPSDTGH